jgi:hypothetical protein
MPSPTLRYFKKKALLLKVETTYGTDPTPTGAANWLEARNLTLTPYDATVEDRAIVAPWMGNGSKLITGQRLKLAFDVALAASGVAGTAPKIAPLLRACGFAETVSAGVSVAYSLISSAFESCTFWMWIDGVRHKGLGARGSCTVKLDKGIPLLHVELTALYVAPTDTANPSVTTTGWPTEQPVNAKNTLVCKVNSVDSWYSKFEINQGNAVQHNDLPGGYEELVISDRAPTASLSMLAPTLATLDPFALASAATNIPIQVVHGLGAGSQVQVDLKARIVGAAYEDIGGTTGYNLTLSPDPVSGNDEVSITFL